MGSIETIFNKAFENAKGVFSGSFDLVDTVLGQVSGSLGDDAEG